MAGTSDLGMANKRLQAVMVVLFSVPRNSACVRGPTHTRTHTHTPPPLRAERPGRRGGRAGRSASCICKRVLQMR